MQGHGPGGWDGDRYQQRFDALAASGVDVHGEAGFVADLGPASVLDAGCGTGRVAIELARRGIEVVGVDVDKAMIATARRLAPDLTWVVTDLTRLDLGRRFEVVVLAGNVPIFAAEGSHQALVDGCARHLAEHGALVAGFQLGRGYPLATYDEHCRRAGLLCVERWDTWSRDPFTDGDYAVSVHRSAADTAPL
ncbi:MAG: class I SAM-dependent methyltransferase [Acidimicrobiales bacterium]